MDKKPLILTAVFLAACIFFAYFQPNSVLVKTLKSAVGEGLHHLKEPVVVQRIVVLDGNEFDLGLADGRQIHAKLEVEVVPEAKDKVVKLINECVGPRVILYYADDKGIWSVDLLLVFEGKEVKLTEWLHEQKLSLDRVALRPSENVVESQLCCSFGTRY